jgi:uncharacterized coiled-coil protein SlyX
MSIVELVKAVIVPLIVAILVGIGSSAVTTVFTTARLELRVEHLEKKTELLAHSAEAANKVDTDVERRVTRMETNLDAITKRLDELRVDIKSVLRSVQVKD